MYTALPIANCGTGLRACVWLRLQCFFRRQPNTGKNAGATGKHRFLFVFICVHLWLISSCGYHVAGKADLVPKNVKTIAIPAFTNVTTRYKLTDRLPEAITREFISRTR